MSQPQHIEHIPAEIWTKILVEAEPIDILSVGQTCRYLHNITSSKDLWRGLVNIMCTKHDLFRPSYPVEQMTLIQLQRATVGPSLFARRLQHRGASFGTPLSEASCLKSVSRFIVSPPRATFFKQLVPGGRFMVLIYASSMPMAALAGTSSLTMELVDFGPPGSPLPSEPAQRYVLPNLGRVTHGMSLEASFTTTSQSGPETLMVGLAMVDTNGTCVASIFAITPTRPAPSFDRLASATITNTFSRETVQEMLICEENALLILGNTFIVWNFTEQTCVVIHHNVTSPMIIQTILTEDEIICIATSGVYQWTLSDKKAESQSTSEGILLDSLPPLRFPDAVILPPWDPVKYYIPQMASGNHKLPLTFDVFAIPRERRSPDTIAVGTRYTLQKYPSQPTQHTSGAVHSAQLHARRLTLALEHSYEVPLRYIMMPFGLRPCLYPGLSTLKGFLTSSGTADWELNGLPGRSPNGFPISLIYWISPQTQRRVSDYTGGMRFVLLGPGPLLSWCPASSRCLFYHGNMSLPIPPETAFEVFDYMS